jgi:hypothetical protein
MMIDKRQLLCTFSTISSFKNTIEEIRKFYNVYNNRFFVFENENNNKDVYITYNILNSDNKFKKFLNTISIHRKKESSTLFSLDALNVLIKEECGCLNKSFVLDWNLFKNSFIITGDVSVRIIPIKLIDIIS